MKISDANDSKIFRKQMFTKHLIVIMYLSKWIIRSETKLHNDFQKWFDIGR